jgi:DNA mismatch repair protein MutS2
MLDRWVLAELDAAQAKALFGKSCGGLIVEPADDNPLVLCGARHPLLDQRLKSLREQVLGEADDRLQRDIVPLEFTLPDNVRTLIISGPNAGGKTVALKTIGLMIVLAYQGIPLPVEEGTRIPRVDNLWCHIGDEQSVSDDLSTFSGAMTATAQLLTSVDQYSLVLYDELGAGTDPLEGAALGCAVIEALTQRGAITLATTHLASIAMTAGEDDRVVNGAMDFDEDRKAPTYRLRLGRLGRSRALEIAERVGIENDILERARVLLGGQHLELDSWLQRLEALEAELLDERSALAREQLELAKQRRFVESRLQALDDLRISVEEKLDEERARLQMRAKKQLDDAIAKLKKATKNREPLGKRRIQQVRDEALDLPRPPREKRPSNDPSWAPGDHVRVDGVKEPGVIEQIRHGAAKVAVGGKRLWTPLEQLVRVAPPEAKKMQSVESVLGEAPTRELQLLGMDSESARDELESFLDRALSTGLTRVRIVHGHGTGTLRRLVQEVCRTHAAVRSFAHPHQRFGGTGATEVELDVGP